MARAFQVLERSGVAGRLERLPARAASEAELRLVHTAGHVERMREACAKGEYLWVGPDARVGPDSWEPALLSAGGALAAVEWVAAGGDGRERLCADATARPSLLGRRGDGLLPLQQRRPGGATGPAARPPASRDRRLGRAPRQRHRGRLPRRPLGAVRLPAPGRPLPGRPRPGRGSRRGRGPRRNPQRPPPRRLRRRRLSAGDRGRSSSPRCAPSGPT